MARLAPALTLGILFAFTAAASSAAPAVSQPRKPTAPGVDPEAAAIRQAALDYIEGWYEGDAERMARAVHPELVKRIVTVRDGNAFLDQMGASRLVAGVKAGHGAKTPKDKQRRDVTILDHYGNAASVKVVAGEWIDYLHVARIDGQWRIVNVLWELTPAAAPTVAPAPAGATPPAVTSPAPVMPPPRPATPPPTRRK
jgi:hypothetical protein